MTEAERIAHLEVELKHYKTECNKLGAAFLRSQEEQGQANREARRTRTVVKLVREAYRLGDLKTIGADFGGPMLEIVVDNTLCDRAALLREDPIGSGRFVVLHAIGLKLSELEDISFIPKPPNFCFSSTQRPLSVGLHSIAAVLALPYILWAYDPNSGQALLIGNRSESNVSHRFEADDRELIESALSVYLDVIYRKQIEAELRRAKQAAESAGQNRSELLDMLAEELRPAMQALGSMSSLICPVDGMAPSRAETERHADDIARTTAYMLSLLDDAVRSGERSLSEPKLNVEWVHVEDLVRAVLRMVYVPSVRRGIELDTTLPHRRTAICVDRARMIQVLRFLVAGAMRLTLEGGAVRVDAARRGDGALEILVRGGAGLVLAEPDHAPAGGMLADPQRSFGSGLNLTRRLIEAQGATLLVEAGLHGLAQARILVPAGMTRDDDVSELE